MGLDRSKRYRQADRQTEDVHKCGCVHKCGGCLSIVRRAKERLSHTSALLGKAHCHSRLFVLHSAAMGVPRMGVHVVWCSVVCVNTNEHLFGCLDLISPGQVLERGGRGRAR